MPYGIYDRSKAKPNKGMFQKGHSVPVEWRKNLSKILKGRIAWNKGIKTGIIPKFSFKKGHIPWNKGKNNPKISKERNRNWKGGKRIDNGYICILQPTHPFCTISGYIREHRLVMENHIGRYLLPSERIHHLNGNKRDNRIENLKLFANESIHRKEHKKVRNNLGQFIN